MNKVIYIQRKLILRTKLKCKNRRPIESCLNLMLNDLFLNRRSSFIVFVAAASRQC